MGYTSTLDYISLSFYLEGYKLIYKGVIFKYIQYRCSKERRMNECNEYQENYRILCGLNTKDLLEEHIVGVCQQF